MSTVRKSEFGDEIDQSIFGIRPLSIGSRPVSMGSRPLSIVEAVQSLVININTPAESPPNLTNAKTANPAVYRYYIGFGGVYRFLLFLGLCAIFVSAMTFNR